MRAKCSHGTPAAPADASQKPLISGYRDGVAFTNRMGTKRFGSDTTDHAVWSTYRICSAFIQPPCTRSAHATLQPIETKNESFRSTMGATHNRCDKSFIQLMAFVPSRSNGYSGRLIISHGQSYLSESAELWRSEATAQSNRRAPNHANRARLSRAQARPATPSVAASPRQAS